MGGMTACASGDILIDGARSGQGLTLLLLRQLLLACANWLCASVLGFLLDICL